MEVNAFLNTKLLKKVRHVGTLLDINFNEVVENNDLVGDLPEYTEVSIYIKIIENILSLERVKEKCMVIFDSEYGNWFVINKSYGNHKLFHKPGNGLDYIGVKKVTDWLETGSKTIMVNTVSNNITMYSDCNHSHVVESRKL